MCEMPLDVMGRREAGGQLGHSCTLGSPYGWMEVGSLQGPEIKQSLWHHCDVLSHLLAHDAHGQEEQREKSQQHAADMSTLGTGYGSHQHKNG